MSGKHKHSGKHESATKNEDRLRRDTPFLCPVKFRNSLPEVPCDPKMLITPLDTEGISKFQLTTLEKEMRHDLLLDSGSGIQISMLDIDRYIVPEDPPPLEPEDAALLLGYNSAADDRKGPGAARERLRGEQTELNWLMRTTYIAHDAPGKARQKDSGALPNGEAASGSSREELLQDIEEGFAAAERPPKHISNPALEAVEILPVLPDLEHWDDHFAHVKFDGDPTEDVPSLARLSEDDKHRVAEHALIKSYNLAGEGAPIKLLALLLPKGGDISALEAAQSSSGAESSEREDVYDWVREYDYRVRPPDEHEHSYWFGFNERAVTYGRIYNRISTQRNSKIKATPGYARPSEVRVMKRKAETLKGTEEDSSKRAAPEDTQEQAEHSSEG
ncbi:hypothetical protein CVIRNUC_004029 [Coccomyxa viridis]|uniref:RNA polymerase II-associated factor 1 n=1 Tax=Coccomyxa viridis TaxID=1274662 RepID=A0AAV1I099_9CHLO|nr:hypothetical protein CVIRNUC_004029 [Coccomyxa viridis]